MTDPKKTQQPEAPAEPAAQQQPGTDSRSELNLQLQRGIAAARVGRYDEALKELEGALAAYKSTGKLPARVLSYYGLCLAAEKGKVADGLECCRIAISKDQFHADHYVNMARIYVLGKARKKAIDALHSAEKLEADNTSAAKLWAEIGRRKAPPLGFLPRNHPVNQFLGRLKRKKT